MSDFLSDLGQAAGWISDDLGGYASDAFGYIQENEWASDFLAGAAGAAGGYMLQKDQQKFDRRMAQERRQNELYDKSIVTGNINMDGYRKGLVGNGSLTDGLLTGGR